MLSVDMELPPGTLLPVDELVEVLAAQNAVWFSAKPEWVQQNGERIECWTARTENGIAYPAEPNTGDGRLSPEGIHFSAGVHCGYSIDVDTDCTRYSIIIRYQSPVKDARTLISIHSKDNATPYLFLSERPEELELKRDKTRSGVSFAFDPNPGHWTQIVMSVSADALALGVGTKPAVYSEKSDAGFASPGAIFVGCRSHRNGLLKTLGTFVLSDMVFLPDIDLLDPGQTTIRTQLQDALSADHLEGTNGL